MSQLLGGKFYGAAVPIDFVLQPIERGCESCVSLAEVKLGHSWPQYSVVGLRVKEGYAQSYVGDAIPM